MVNKNQLNDEVAKKVEQQARKIIKQESKKLERITQSVVNSYYASYTPKQYVRTYGFKKSVITKDIRRIGDRIEVSVGFSQSAVHNSLFKGQPSGYVPILIDQGWHSARLESRIGEVPRLTRYGGYNLIDKILKTYKAVKHPLVTIRVEQ